MSYFTGTANNSTDLKSLIETKAVLEGWTLTSGWLNKGINHIKLTVPDAYTLAIEGANSDDGLTTPAGITRCTWSQASEWPVTYYLHLNVSPDMIVLVYKHAVNRIQTLMFGNIVKVHDSAFVGGNFYFATMELSTRTVLTYGLYQITNTLFTISDQYPYDESNIIPFTSPAGYRTTNDIRRTPMHVEIDGDIWEPIAGGTVKTTYTDATISSLYRSPNLYNSQAHLVPMNLQYAMADGLFGYLGYVEHVRLIRIDNYEIADTVTISPDVWKVYPWYKKDVVYRNGIESFGANQASGTLGLAVRYIT